MGGLEIRPGCEVGSSVFFIDFFRIKVVSLKECNVVGGRFGCGVEFERDYFG